MNLPPLHIPPIEDNTLALLSNRAKPVARDAGGELQWIEICDPRAESFLYDPKPTHPASALIEHARIRTLHSFGFPLFFKPTIAEVLAQIPAAYMPRTVGFETIGPDDYTEMKQQPEALEANFHIATTILYRWP